MILSIITVASRDPIRLKKTLESLAEIPSEVEHITVIPAFDVATLQVWHNFRKINGPGFKLINDSGNGVYPAMNNGILVSSGKYICFWNAGDELVKTDEPLSEVIDIVKAQEPGWIIVQGIFDWREDMKLSHLELNDFIIHKMEAFISHQTTIVSRRYFNTIGLFSPRFRVASDTAVITQLVKFSLPLLIEKKLVRVEKPNFASRHHRRARVESLAIAVFHLRGRQRMQALRNIVLNEINMLRGRTNYS